MKIKETVGIDISKLSFDARVHTSQEHQVFDNQEDGFKDLISWAYGKTAFSTDEVIFVFEHTGLYSHQLALYLESKGIPSLWSRDWRSSAPSAWQGGRTTKRTPRK